MNKTKLTLSIDKKLLDHYKDYCKREGLIISRQIEKFIEKQLKEKRVWKKSETYDNTVR